MYDSHLLVAVVDTEAGRNAARQAVQLAVSSGSRLSAVAVMPELEGDVDRLHVDDVVHVMEEPHEAALETVRQYAREAGISVQTYLRQGQPHEQIVDQAESLDANVIVLGESRRNIVERALIGPTAARVIGYSRMDVLVIPAGTEIGFDKLLLALDGSAGSKAAAGRALDLADQYASRILATTVLQMHPESSILENYVAGLLEKARAIVAEFEKEAAAKGHFVASHVAQGGDVASEIVQKAASWAADMVVMGSHGRTGLRRLLMGSVAESVLARVHCPVLIVH